MMFLSIILLFTTHGCLKLDIILVADLSGSVYRYEYFVADAFDAFINRFELSETGALRKLVEELEKLVKLYKKT